MVLKRGSTRGLGTTGVSIRKVEMISGGNRRAACASSDSVTVLHVLHTNTLLPTRTTGPNKCVANHKHAGVASHKILNGTVCVVRAHQRDLIHVSSLREQTENILRSWFGESPPPPLQSGPRSFTYNRIDRLLACRNTLVDAL
jgi:hypothetical protein